MSRYDILEKQASLVDNYLRSFMTEDDVIGLLLQAVREGHFESLMKTALTPLTSYVINVSYLSEVMERYYTTYLHRVNNKLCSNSNINTIYFSFIDAICSAGSPKSYSVYFTMTEFFDFYTKWLLENEKIDLMMFSTLRAIFIKNSIQRIDVLEVDAYRIQASPIELSETYLKKAVKPHLDKDETRVISTMELGLYWCFLSQQDGFQGQVIPTARWFAWVMGYKVLLDDLDPQSLYPLIPEQPELDLLARLTHYGYLSNYKNQGYFLNNKRAINTIKTLYKGAHLRLDVIMLFFYGVLSSNDNYHFKEMRKWLTTTFQTYALPSPYHNVTHMLDAFLGIQSRNQFKQTDKSDIHHASERS